MSQLQRTVSVDLMSIKDKFNKFLYTPANIIVFAILTLLTYIFSLEIIFYTFVVLYGIYVIALCPDLTPIIPLFTLCYFAVSKGNNPGVSDQGVFYSNSVYLICLVAAVIIALILRISLDKKIGWKVFFTKRRKLMPGLLLLSGAYLLSGLGSEHYAEFAKNNFIFAVIQIMSVVLLYFVFSATIDWKKFDVDYFAYSQLFSGLVVVFELIWVYISDDIVIDGTIDRVNIFTGWGTYNNIGAMIALAIPFAFYLACKKKHSMIYLLSALFLMGGIVFSCSRGSMVCASIAFLVLYIYTFINANNKMEFRTLSVILLVILAIILLSLFSSIKAVFKDVPKIADIINGNVVFNDYNRFNIYAEGIKAFLKNPVFGQSFYSFDYDIYDFSVVDKFSTLIPPRWHNTFVQLLASCGLVGLCAYLFHRFQTCRLLAKKRTKMNFYIGIFILTLMGMSLLDCHFFNIGPVLVYSIALAVMEFGNSSDK